MLAADGGFAATTVTPWHNVLNPADVDGDGYVAPSDALAIFNELNRGGSRSLEANPPEAIGMRSSFGSFAAASTMLAMVDVDSDGFLTPSDALIVFNQLNAVEPLVVIRLETTDLLGNPITAALVGEDFLLRAFVQDPNAAGSSGGVFSAYMDVTYDSSLVAVDGSITFGASFPNVQSGSTAIAGEVDEVGGTIAGSPLGPGEFLLFSLPYTATAAGTVTFETNPADDLPFHRILLSGGSPTGVPPENVAYGSISLDVVLLPKLSVGNVTVTEAVGNSIANFEVKLSHPSSEVVTVDVSTLGLTATSGLDFQATAGTLTFQPGEVSKFFPVVVLDDFLDEDDEQFAIVLSNPSHAEGDGVQAVATIVDNDDAPSISIEDTSVIEGNVGTTNAQFFVNLSSPSGKTISVSYSTSDGTALAGSDYTATSGVVVFAPGETSKAILIPVLGDTVDEPDETFFVTLTSPENATLEDATATGTIIDDDLPTMTIADASLVEGDSGTLAMQFTVTLTTPAQGTVSVNYTTVSGTATAGVDFQPVSNTLVFSAGQSQRTISVPIIGDLIREPNETFEVVLSSPSGAVLGDDRATGTIIDNDPTPTITIQGGSASEGNFGTSPLSFTVTLSNPSSTPITVQYATGAGSASEGVDYQAASGTVTFAPGQVQQTISINIIGDLRDEFDETVSVVLSNASGASIGGAQATGTIVDDDAPPAVSINDVSQFEGNAGTTNFVFTVSLSAPSDKPITVFVSTYGITAESVLDFFPASGTVTFAPGVTATTFSVPVFGDETPEPNEIFGITLSSPTNATIGRGTGQGIVLNDDAPLSSISGYVFVDNASNNNRRDPGETGIAGTAIVLTGVNDRGQTVNRTAVTNDAGYYHFADVRPGQYTVQEIHPAFFRDGNEQLGSVGGSMQNDRFDITLGPDTHATEYNFGELGLRSNFIGKRLFLTSTQPGVLLSGSYIVDTRAGDLYFSFSSGWSGPLTFLAAPSNGGRATLTLYDVNLSQLATSAPAPGATAQLTYSGTLGQPYFLKVGGGSVSTLQLVQGAGFSAQTSSASTQAWAWYASQSYSNGASSNGNELDALDEIFARGL
ncbi:MAG: hypothetical protein KF708_16190 [Pirellulales bacterium]|nr:hypothetical protein [Pirellulales bacterium]